MERKIYEIEEQLAKLIEGLCDIALKSGGLQNKLAVDYVLSSFRPEKKPEASAVKIEDVES
jgi:hypothetical protein